MLVGLSLVGPDASRGASKGVNVFAVQATNRNVELALCEDYRALVTSCKSQLLFSYLKTYFNRHEHWLWDRRAANSLEATLPSCDGLRVRCLKSVARSYFQKMRYNPSVFALGIMHNGASLTGKPTRILRFHFSH